MTNTSTFVELPVSFGAFTEIKELLQAHGCQHAVIATGGHIVIDMEGIGLICAEPESQEAKGRKRIMAIEPPSCVDVKCGVFTVTKDDNTTEEIDFYVRTCQEVEPNDPAYEQVRAKRDDDRNEQYTDVASRMWTEYKHVAYQEVVPDPLL